MNLQLKQFDHIQLSGHLRMKFACDYSEDGKIFILSDNGIYILTLKGYMESTVPRFSFKKDHIDMFNTNIVNETLGMYSLSKEAYQEVVMDPNLLGDSIKGETMTACPVFAMWSPRGIVEKTDCALAVLTNLNNIEIYIRVYDENELTNFVRVVNFSKDINDYYKRNTTPSEDRFSDLKKQLNVIIPTTFTWSHVILKERKACCILFVGHRDGCITTWRFIERKGNENHESKMEFLARYKTKVKNITALHWFCRKSDGGTLSVGDSEGRFCCLTVSKLSTDKMKFCEEVVFNDELLGMQVNKITIIDHQKVTYLVLVLQTYLLVYAVNDVGDVTPGKLIQVENSHITGILHYEKNVLLILAECGELKQIELGVVDKEVSIKEQIIELDFDSSKYRTHGFLMSPNKVFLGILAYPCKLVHIVKNKACTNFLVYGNMLQSPLRLLLDLEPDGGSLRDHWDCLETLRVVSIQEKRFPWEGLEPNPNYDRMSLLRLKILRWVAMLSEKVYPMIPRVEEYHIKPYVLLNYAVDIKLAVQRMTKLLNIHFSDKSLSLFQMRSLDLLNFFLKEVVAKDILTKAHLGTVFVDEIYNVMRIANELEYPPALQCIWCGEPVIGSACIPHHPDSRCSISLMPIKMIPGFKCPFCKCVVSKEMSQEYYPMFCPYCDVPMERRYQDRRNKRDPESKRTMDSTGFNSEGTVTSDCFSDCLKEDVHLTDLEDNTVDYAILSDNDEDTRRETDKKVKNLFATVTSVLCADLTAEGKVQVLTKVTTSVSGQQSAAVEGEKSQDGSAGSRDQEDKDNSSKRVKRGSEEETSDSGSSESGSESEWESRDKERVH